MFDHVLHEAEFWVAVSSVITFGFLIKKAWAPIIDALDSRSQVIKSRLDEAENLYLEADKLLKDYQSRQASAMAEADAILAAAQRRAEAIVQQAETDMQRTIAYQENNARMRIQRAERDIVESIREAMVKAALLRVETALSAKDSQVSDVTQLVSYINTTKQ